jgi:PPP family 3-phenylpropionic acid transporter
VLSPAVRAAAAYVALFTAVGASFPYLSVYYQGVGLSLATIGGLSALGAGLQLIASPAWGIVADRLARSRLVVPAAALTAALGATLLAILPAQWIVVGVLVLASGLAGLIPVLDARALETVDADRDRYGRLRACGSAAFIASAWLVGALIDRAGIRSLFAVYIPGLIATALVTTTLRPAGGPRPLPRFEGLRAVLANRRLVRFLLAILLTWSALLAMNSFFSIHLVALGAPAALVGAAWGLGALVEIPLMWSFPALAARFGAERLLVVGASSLAFRAVATAFTTHPVVAVGLMPFSGIGFAFVLVGAVTYVSRRAPAGAAATAQGVLTAVSFALASIFGAGFGGVAAGALGIRGMYVLAAAASVLAVVAVAIATRRDREATVEPHGPGAPAAR